VSLSIKDYGKYFQVRPLKPEVVYAGEFLEARGYRFGVEYGTSSAVAKATEIVLEDLELAEGYGFGV